ncbi:general odorant-binding protein 99b-like [Toxorhynchites rutilus septentrionalis]|uniref:general odorant-binding protein 99b-like n=1 Tax=Toxorhynchites rutilus septentrionalis TaxID=329112 RepID=UPI00247A63D0|nr:general odorant-binding protein 99b-like [Toxorhynchites rutilus septentrionalis]
MGFVARCILALALVALVSSSHTIKSLVDECKPKVEISEELEKSFLALEFPSEEKTTHCLMQCIGQSLNLFEENGNKANRENIKEVLKELKDNSSPAEELSEEQKHCLDEAEKKVDADEENECLMAFRIYDCFEKEFKELMEKHSSEE